jgi:hypothetical protein
LLCEARQSGFLSRCIATTYPTRKSKQNKVRYLDIYQDDELDEAQLAAWVKQASLLPATQM